MRKTLYSILPLVVFFAPGPGRLDFRSTELATETTRNERSAPRVSSADQRHAYSLRARAALAKSMMRQRPAPAGTDSITVAVEDAATSEIHLLDINKQLFLTKDNDLSVVSSAGEQMRVRVVRPNFVNTAVRVSSESGRELRPLVVQYPIEKNGQLSEVAYYTSAHPATASAALVRSGNYYVREKLDNASRDLARHGKEISPDVLAVAERLCVVEHTDHKRFKTEPSSVLFDEIFALYALNSGDTYRYSVSTAGAGGMVQMIPPTYHAMRNRYAKLGLNEDFVEGMRDHENALKVMLLYMQDTWDDLLDEDEVRSALRNGIAKQAELLAAGYNSNPMRLAGYLKRGGSAWRSLIPEETKMYLKIYAAVESNRSRPAGDMSRAA